MLKCIHCGHIIEKYEHYVKFDDGTIVDGDLLF